MLEDKALIWQLKHGNIDALRRIYEKYKHELLALAFMLCRDRAASEDAVRDVFVTFAGATAELELRTNLRSCLLAHAANRVRDMDRSKEPSGIGLDELIPIRSGPKGSPHRIIRAEQARHISEALDELPDLQREVVILHLQTGMRFKDIARAQGVSLNTARDRFQHGLDNLKSVQDNGSEEGEIAELMFRFFQQKKAAVKTSEQMDRDIVDYALEAYVEARKKKFTVQGPDWHETVLRSMTVRIAAAALVVLIVVLAVVFSGSQPQQEQTPGETTVSEMPTQNVPSQTAREGGFAFEDIDRMLASRNVDGVVSMISQADFKTRAAAAEYLSRIGDEQAVMALVELSEKYPKDYLKNPFLMAIEQITSSAEPADQPHTEVEIIEPEDLSPDIAGPNLAEAPNDTAVTEPNVIKAVKGPPERTIDEALLSDTGPSPTSTEGVYGGGYYFDGVHDYIYVGAPPGLTLSESVTFEAWIYPTDPDSDEPVIAKEGPGGNQAFWFGVYQGQFGLLLNDGSDGWALSARNSGSLSNNRWQHIASTWDGSVWRNYLNGVLTDQGEWTGVIANSPAPVTIGSDSDFDFTKFAGLIDEVRVWNYARSTENIAADMNGVLITAEPGLVGYWSFDSDEGQVVKDSGSNGNDGTLSNTRPELTEGVSDRGYYFDGHGDYIEIGAVEGLNAEQTKMLWIYPATWTSPRGAYLIDEGRSRNSNNWIELYDFDGNGTWEIRAGYDASSYFDSDGLIIDPGRWYHIAAVSTASGDVSIYINGTPDSNESGLSALAVPESIIIGADPQTKKECFTGAMDEVAIFSRALTAEEILQIYQNAGRLTGDEPELVGYWNFDSDEADVVRDSSPNGNHGRLGGW